MQIVRSFANRASSGHLNLNLAGRFVGFSGPYFGSPAQNPSLDVLCHRPAVSMDSFREAQEARTLEAREAKALGGHCFIWIEGKQIQMKYCERRMKEEERG